MPSPTDTNESSPPESPVDEHDAAAAPHSETTDEEPKEYDDDLNDDATEDIANDEREENASKADEPSADDRPVKKSADNDTADKLIAIESSFKLDQSTLITKRNSKQYEYIKHGSRIKALLSTAFRAVSDGLSANLEGGKKRNACDDEDEEGGASKKTRGMNEIHAEDLARERTEECVNLKRVRGQILC
jgi:hypothetical protein